MLTMVLRTKLYIPQPARLLIARNALIRRLDEGLVRDLTLVVAPVGYGKTTLVASWARQSKVPVTWLALNDSDNNLLVFTAYLVASIRSYFPSACPHTKMLLDSGQMPDPELLATLLTNEIDDLPQRFVLVLDDYHSIRASEIHQLLDYVLRHPPLQMHLVIASRADPPLALARLRAGQRMNELRIKDLRFSQSEAENFLVQAIDLAGQSPVVREVVQRTEGWVVGLQLAALSLRSAPDEDAMLQSLAHGSDRYILDYLFEQVLNRQPHAVQSFLLKTSILDQVSLALAAATIGDAPDTIPVSLAQLERTGIFVDALDNRGEWYGYHALFRELLRNHLAQHSSRQEVSALHRRASDWLRKAGIIDAALHHALAGDDVDGAAQIIVDHFATWLDREDWPSIERWLNQMPATALASHPWLLVAKANIAQFRSDYGAVLPLIEEAEMRLANRLPSTTSSGEVVLRAYLDLLWAVQTLLDNDTQRAIGAAKHALQALPLAHRYVRGTALNLLTVAMQASGQAEAAVLLLENELARTPHNTVDAYTRLRVLLCLMSLHLAEGRISEGEVIANLLLKEATAANAPISQLWAHLGLGAAAYERNDLPHALEHFTRGAELRYVGHMRGGHECLIGLALTYQSLGRTAEGQGVASLLIEYHRESGNIGLAAEGKLLQLYLQVLAGTLPAETIRTSPRTSFMGLLFGWKMVPAITQVHALLAGPLQATPGETAHLLDELLHTATALHKPARVAEFLALRALLHERQAEPAAAVATLRRAVAIGEPLGLVRSIVDAGGALRPPLLALALATPSPYLDRLLAAHQPSASNDDRPQSSLQSTVAIRLTRREREVLALLMAYKSDREIAEELIISPLTVRTHIEHLSEKLSASGRRSIVARAAELNLLG